MKLISAQEFDKGVDKACELLDSGRTAEAMSIAQQLVDQRPGDATAWIVWSMAKEEWEDYDMAIKGYKQVIAIDPQNDFAIGHLGLCYFNKGMFQDALRELEKAISLNPDDDFMYTAVAAVANINGIDAAIAKCNTYLATAKNKIPLENKLGQCYVAKASTFFTEAPDGQSYLTSKTAVNSSREYCNKALTLMTLTDLCADDIKQAQEILRLCDISDSKKFAGYLLKAALIWVVVGFIVTAFLPWLGIIMLIFGCVGIAACRVPQWRINERALSGKNNYTIFQAVMDLFKK